ncbi:hypothetical protein N7462_009697 [Penicillium macrosclerotiorum]|uniref:uncharacterized protein n=1 Tax=Penicillium macrosclerotiorum TaxID=303699 RepID=UPI00254724AE|nr:uncharacterized protein N7462_009697 [Penicillium macrosclerotiorum]KAJ5674258.1 hypothetical protein N7462_009697 [Penicillium macrosclerotiorum]
MTQPTAHRRAPSSPHAHSSKPKTIRPVLHRRGTSGVSLSISKLGAGSHTRSVNRDDETDLDMAASFLNFCAMCERQITIPNNSLLYCSERCRRKDSCKPLSASLPSMSNMSTMSSTMTPSYTTASSTSISFSTSPPASPPLSPRTIVAPMTPTRMPSTSLSSIRIPTVSHDGKSDLDPTEWKPVELAGNRGSSTSLASSAAWSYLSQFHGHHPAVMLPQRRTHRSTTSLPALDGGASHTPSLVNTPSSIASSVSSTASDYLAMYEPSVPRPLPPRHNPLFAGSAATKDVALVVPRIASTAEEVGVAELSDSGSIFPASSAVWEDCEKTAAPIRMVRSLGVEVKA